MRDAIAGDAKRSTDDAGLGRQAMQWTIKKRLATLTISGLVFVAAVSATGYWGITSVEHATTQVSATSMAIRSHIEAGIFNDMTWADISAIFAKKGQEQQDNVDNSGPALENAGPRHC